MVGKRHKLISVKVLCDSKDQQNEQVIGAATYIVLEIFLARKKKIFLHLPAIKPSSS